MSQLNQNHGPLLTELLQTIFGPTSNENTYVTFQRLDSGTLEVLSADGQFALLEPVSRVSEESIAEAIKNYRLSR